MVRDGRDDGAHTFIAGREYTIGKTQVGFTIKYEPIDRASNAGEEDVGVIKMVSKAIPMHWSYGVVTLNAENGEQSVAPLIGAALVVPYFGEKDDADRAKEQLTAAANETGMARQKRDGTNVDWQSMAYFTSASANQMNALIRSAHDENDGPEEMARRFVCLFLFCS